MRRLLFVCLLLLGSLGCRAAELPEGRILKVLPMFLDHKGRHILLPSLYERDAYQAYLQANPSLVSGRRFAIQWKTKGGDTAPVLLKVELRGIAHGTLPRELQIYTFVKPGGTFGKWTLLDLSEEDYEQFGEVTAWRASLWARGPWEEEILLAEQRSFLW